MWLLLFSGLLWITFYIGVLTILLFYWYATQNHNYWKKRGVPYVKPLPLFGSSLEPILKPIDQVLFQHYKELGPIYGYFETSFPVLNVGDPALLKEIMVKDFSSFTSRRKGKTGDKLFDNLVSTLRGDDWKRVRSIITPTFSTGKIKRMLGIFKECSETVCQNFRNTVNEGKSVDVKRLYGAFTMDVIASSAFSTKIDSHNDPDNEFVRTARDSFSPKLSAARLIFVLFPSLFKIMRKFSSSSGRPLSHFFISVTHEIIAERRKTGQKRNDFLQLLMDTASETSEEKKPSEKEKDDIASNYAESDAGHQIFKSAISKSLSMDELVAQCVIFFLAGYHTTASTLSFVTYLLALNQDVQDKARQEVDDALNSNNGILSYEVIQSLKYLDNIISESLRIYPAVTKVERVADNDYKLSTTGITIEKDMTVSIPIIALHRDPKYYPNPEKFDPDRFTPEESAKRDPYTYLPFGAGPRNCVGMRFALLEIKACLAYVLSTFKILRSPQTKVPLEIGFGVQGLLQPKDIIVDMELRKDAKPIK